MPSPYAFRPGKAPCHSGADKIGYQQMNGMPLREMDKSICPVRTFFRDHEKAGFIAGIKVGMEIKEE
jgi:hypothetical protein